MPRNRRRCATCRNRSSAARRTGRGRSPACAGVGSADTGGAARRGDRRGARGTCQHGAQLAGLLRAWRSGGTAAAPETGTAGHDRAARWSDRGGEWLEAMQNEILGEDTHFQAILDLMRENHEFKDTGSRRMNCFFQETYEHCEGEVRECQTCQMNFCESHSHATPEVECSACELIRHEQSISDPLDPIELRKNFKIVK